MRDAYLEITFRRGKILAAYLYLPRKEGMHTLRSERVSPGMVVDFAEDGRPIGIEMTAPALVAPEMVNQLLQRLGMPGLEPEELEPLKAA